MASTPAFPLTITASGTYLICAAGDKVAAAGTLVQLTGSASWTAYLAQNTASGVEAPVLTPVTVMNRATGYTQTAVPNGTIFGDTDSPVTVEVPARSGDLYLTVAIYSGTGITVNVWPCPFSTARPAGAYLSDLNFDATPVTVVDEDLEVALDQSVSAYTGT